MPMLENSWEDAEYTSDEYTVYINPRITGTSDRVIEEKETSLSSPTFNCQVKRYESIEVSYNDESMGEQTKELNGFQGIF
jgi:peptide deformylase